MIPYFGGGLSFFFGNHVKFYTIFQSLMLLSNLLSDTNKHTQPQQRKKQSKGANGFKEFEFRFGFQFLCASLTIHFEALGPT